MRKVFLPVVTCLLAACGGDAPLEPLGELPHSAAVSACGPADGPATYIYLSPTPVELPLPAAPFVQVFVPRRFSESTSGAVFPIGDDINEEASAWFNTSGLEPRQALRGEVGITSLVSNRLTGFVDLVFPNGLRIRGSFDAPWHDSLLLCG